MKCAFGLHFAIHANPFFCKGQTLIAGVPSSSCLSHIPCKMKAIHSERQTEIQLFNLRWSSVTALQFIIFFNKQVYEKNKPCIAKQFLVRPLWSKPKTSARCQKVHRMIRAQQMLNTKNSDWPFTVGAISIPLGGPWFPSFSKKQMILSEEINI